MKIKLLFTCTGPGVSDCLTSIEVPLDDPIDRDSLTAHLRTQNWFLSVVTEPGQGRDVPIVFAAICEPCAKKVMPSIVEEVKDRETRLLSERNGRPI